MGGGVAQQGTPLGGVAEPSGSIVGVAVADGILRRAVRLASGLVRGHAGKMAAKVRQDY